MVKRFTEYMSGVDDDDDQGMYVLWSDYDELERENKALHLLVDSEWGEHPPEQRKAWLERILREHEHPEEEI